MKTHGLTLGKFAPLHKGHEYVIQTALKEMDTVTVIIYDTDVTTISLTTRAQWIKMLYPNVHVIEVKNGPVGEPFDPTYEAAEEAFIKAQLKGQKITHFYSSEYYGKHVSNSLGAIDRRVDDAREMVPIQATLIRENPYQYRNFLHPLIYRDLITKVVFLGAMSTGKSTITEALAKKYNTTYVAEYGRTYWEQHQVDRRITFEAFDEIAIGHIECEEQAFQEANRYCFIDTNAITTYMFSLDYHAKASPLLTQLALHNATRYDIFFLCEDDIPYDDTWDRSGDQKRHTFHQQIKADLKQRNIPFIPLKGSLETRIQTVERILKQHIKK